MRRQRPKQKGVPTFNEISTSMIYQQRHAWWTGATPRGRGSAVCNVSAKGRWTAEVDISPRLLLIGAGTSDHSRFSIAGRSCMKRAWGLSLSVDNFAAHSPDLPLERERNLGSV
jgi:hypothetical protein